MKKKKKTKKNKRRTVDNYNEAFKAMGQIIELTDAFCLNHLNEEYRELCEDLVWAAYEERLPFEKGRPAGWASGIVHAIGFVNFLHDPNTLPYMTSTQLAEGFGVSQQTMQTKSKIIRDTFDMIQFDPNWCLPSLLGENPLAWMLGVDGFLMDARDAPLEFQQEAYRLGLIPYIPGESLPDEPQQQSGGGARIIEFPSKRKNTDDREPSQKAKDKRPNLFEELER
jgi:hypothetical protein